MVRIKFFAQDLKDSKKVCANELFFEKIDTAVEILIATQYQRLKEMLPQFRIVCLIENMEKNI
jgi:hypothetical protein